MIRVSQTFSDQNDSKFAQKKERLEVSMYASTYLYNRISYLGSINLFVPCTYLIYFYFIKRDWFTIGINYIWLTMLLSLENEKCFLW